MTLRHTLSYGASPTCHQYCLVTETGVRERLARVVLDSTVGKTRTRDLSITRPTFYLMQVIDPHNSVYRTVEKKVSAYWTIKKTWQ